MEKIVLELDGGRVKWLKAEAKRLKVSFEDYLQRVIYNHSEIVQNHPILKKEGFDELQTPETEDFEKALDYLMDKNRELYKRLA